MAWASSASSTPTGDYRVEIPEPSRSSDVLTRVGSLMASSHVCRDMQISAYGIGNSFLLRVGSGTGLYANFQSDRVVYGMFINGPNAATGTLPNYPNLWTDAEILFSSIAGYSTDPSDVWTFGVSGFDVYLEYNGVEIHRYKESRVLQAGIAVVAGTAASTATVAYVPATLIGSNRAINMIDVRDFGAKPSTVTTTGSMTAGSNLLTVASASGFAVGDQIIVSTGGEAGLGRRGTEGVGGAWPSLSYANAAALLADTSRVSGEHAWDRATGSVYNWDGSVWSNAITPYEDYYRNKAVPKALVAEIIALAGNVMTLSKNAVVSTASANIYVDLHKALLPLRNMQGSPTLDYLKLRIPAGTFAMNGAAATLPNQDYFAGVQEVPSRAGYWNGVKVMGAGKALTTLFAPQGAAEVGLHFNFASNTSVSGLKVIGNHSIGASGEIDGYLFQDMLTGNALGSFPYSIHMQVGLNADVSDCSFESVFTSVTFHQMTDSWYHDCDLTMYQSPNGYTWQSAHNNSLGGGAYNFTVTCPKLIKAFEMFSCDASALGGTVYRNCGGQNALISTNSSHDWLIDEFHSTIIQDSAKDIFISAGYLGEPVIYPSANAYHNGVTGTVRNPRIIVQGYPDTTDNSTFQSLILVSPDCNGVIIEGTYAGASTPFSSALGGYLENVNYVSGAAFNSADAILDRGVNTVIRGIRAVGTTNPASANINNNGGPTWSGGSGTSTVQDCIADTFGIRVGSTKSGNRTNAGVSVP